MAAEYEGCVCGGEERSLHDRVWRKSAANWPKEIPEDGVYGSMPTLVTKDYSMEIALDDEIPVVVPKMYVTPCITELKRGKQPTWSVNYWDTDQWRLRSKKFKTPAEAEAFKAGAWVRDQELLIKNVTAEEVMKREKYFAKFFRIHQEVIRYEHREVPLDSRFVGCWLGDGTSTACSITTADQEILDYITQVAAQFDLHVVIQSKYHYLLTCRPEKETSEEHGMALGTLRKYKDLQDRGELDKYYYDRRLNPITAILKQLGIFGRGKKRIPELYLKNSRKVRLGVLGGIIDTDGHLSLGGYDMCFANPALADDIVMLARSLGFRCSNVNACIKNCTNAAGGSKPCQAYRFRICGGDELRDIPLLLPRKRIKGPKVMKCDLHFKVVP